MIGYIHCVHAYVSVVVLPCTVDTQDEYGASDHYSLCTVLVPVQSMPDSTSTTVATLDRYAMIFVIFTLGADVWR